MTSHTELPRYVPISRACEIFGIGRTRMYDLLGRNHIRAVKCGSKTLIELSQASAWFAALPQADSKRSAATLTRRP